jgi:hypothetical protein
MFPAAEGVYFVKGTAVCAAFMYFAAMLTIILRTWLAWQNKKADETERAIREAVSGDEKLDGNVATENEGFGFRYAL